MRRDMFNAVLLGFVAVTVMVVAVAVVLMARQPASAETVRSHQGFTAVSERRYEPPVAEMISGDLSDAETQEAIEVPSEGEQGATEDESTLSVDLEQVYSTLDSYYEPIVYESSYEDGDFRTQGVVYDDGTRYTWYSERVLPGGGLDELNSNGRTHDGDGYVVDGDGYIAVASSDHEIGTVLETPFGAARVYDTGCASGTVDVYVSW